MVTQWPALIERNSIHRSCDLNIADVVQVHLAQHGDTSNYYGSFINPIRLQGYFTATWDRDLNKAKDAVLDLAQKMLDETEVELKRTEGCWGQPLWDDFDLNRFGFSTRVVSDLIYLRVDRKSFGGYQPVVYTAFGEHCYRIQDDIEDAKATAEEEARIFVERARKEIQQLAEEVA